MNVRIRCDLNFGATVYYDSQFRVNQYSLRLWMTTNHPDPATHNVALDRIKYFVYNELDSTVFINVEHRTQCEKLVAAGMDITTLPTEPVDQVIGIMLFHKLNAVMEQYMIIEETEISSLLGDSITYLHSENELTNGVNLSDWWTAADPIHCDRDMLHSESVLSLPRVSAWRDIDLSWPEYVSDTDPGNVVVFADFKTNETK